MNPNHKYNKISKVIKNFTKFIRNPYHIYIKDLLKALWWGFTLALTVSFIIVCSFLYSRESTIKIVRDKDCEIIYGFVDFLITNNKYNSYNDISRDLQNLLYPLYPGRSPQKSPYIGVSLWENKKLIFSNHYQLSIRKYDEILSLAKKDKRFIIKKYQKPDTQLAIVFFRPEMKYDLNLLYSKNILTDITNCPMIIFNVIAMLADPDVMELSLKRIWHIWKIPFVFTFVVFFGTNVFYKFLIKKQHRKNLRDIQYKENSKEYEEKLNNEDIASLYQSVPANYNTVSEPSEIYGYRGNNIESLLENINNYFTTFVDDNRLSSEELKNKINNGSSPI